MGPKGTQPRGMGASGTRQNPGGLVEGGAQGGLHFWGNRRAHGPEGCGGGGGEGGPRGAAAFGPNRLRPSPAKRMAPGCGKRGGAPPPAKNPGWAEKILGPLGLKSLGAREKGGFFRGAGRGGFLFI